MKIKPSIVLSILFCMIIVGCANPLARFSKQKSKIEDTEKKIQVANNQQNDLSISYVYGANRALSLDLNPNKFTELAKELTDKSLIISGMPHAKDALAFKQIVDGVLSTNKIDHDKARKALDEKDLKIVSLEKKVEDLNSKMEAQEKQFEKQNAENAKDAQLMAFIRKWVRIIGFSFVGIVIFRIVSIFVPQLAPIGMILDGIAGGLFKIFSKALPKAKDAAGLVTKEAYELSEKTLAHVVEAIEEAKKDPKVKEALAPILKDITTKDETRPKILEVKKELGYI